MFTPKPSRKQSANYELRSTTVRVIVALTLLGGAIGTLLLASKSRLSWPQIAQAQGVTTTMATPHAPSANPPPSDFQIAQQSPPSSTLAQGQGRQVFIGFDGLPFAIPTDPLLENVPLWPLPVNQYQDAVFSSDPGYYVVTYGRPYGKPLPGITRATFGLANHFAPLIVDFPNQANDVSFDVLAVDDRGLIATVEIYQKGLYTQTVPLFSTGRFFNLRYSLPFQNLTRIIIRVNDTLGLAFDNFGFTVPPAAPSPTPTPSASPTPTPPPAPTNVRATPDEEQIFVSWTPSQGAAWYVIKRGDDQPATFSTGTSPESLSFAPVNPSFFCDGVSIPCVYEDPNVDTDVTYSYVVAAANNSGTSADSNPPASSKKLPKPGCEWKKQKKDAPNAGAFTSISHLGWSMLYSFSAKDGLVVEQVGLNGRKMAERFSVPYYKITTFNDASLSAPLIAERGELRPDGSSRDDGKLYSRLIGYRIDKLPTELLLEAVYGVENIPGVPKSCLTISVRYEFFQSGFQVPLGQEAPCEPSGTITTCTKFRPVVSYSFHGGKGEHLSSINIPERLHFQVKTDGRPNTLVLTRDKDDLKWDTLNPLYPFSITYNPVPAEFWSSVVKPGYSKKDAGSVDNFHQTNHEIFVRPVVHIIPPWVEPGCPECVHMHWRWSRQVPDSRFNIGQPLVTPASSQSLDIAIVRFHPDPFGCQSQCEEHPEDYGQLLNSEQISKDSLRNTAVFWYSPHGFSDTDTFFWNPAWFNAKDPDKSALTYPAERQSPSTLQVPASNDGPISVNFGDVYRSGPTTFDVFDLSTAPTLPEGYVALNNTAYEIKTSAVVSGPHTINFLAASVTDQNAFNALRIFQIQPDRFDPEKPVWVDCTILSPDMPAADYSSKQLSARSEGLGLFVIGRLVQAVPATDAADISVTLSDSSDPVVAGGNLTYAVIVRNNGPQVATEVAFQVILSPDSNLISVTPTQGTHKFIDGTIFGNLGTLVIGGTASITVVVNPTERGATFPAEGKTISAMAVVRANQIDSTQDNNSIVETTKILPSPNHPPIVSLTTPNTGERLIGPTDITIKATATDDDGTISKVQFFDNSTLIGEGLPSGNNQFVFTEHNVSFGFHSLEAVAVDNGGRIDASEPAAVVVNGSANINVTSPLPSALFAPASNIPLTANASHPSSVITKVEFLANGESIGLGTLNGGSQYNFLWNNVDDGIYSIVAVATDALGATTTSVPVNITVDTPPTVALTTPVDGTIFPSAPNFSVFATAESSHGSISRVDFYAGGVLIGSATDVGTNRYGMTWRHVPNGLYLLSAVATDNLGVTTKSAPITVGVNTPATSAGDFIWFDDDVPPGATKYVAGDGDWYWVDANPGAFSGSKAHQSLNFGQVDSPNTSFHQHSFDGATTTFPVGAGDKLFTYVFLDSNSLPRELMLEWKDASGWEHRAYWGANRINYGTDGTNSRRYMGPVPKAGTWVRLEIPASAVGLEGSTLNGMAFTLDAGRATWDLVGKATSNSTPPPMTLPGDSMWIEDGFPAGAVIDTANTVNDQWNWVTNPRFSGQLAHQSQVSVNPNNFIYRSHAFKGAQTPIQVNPGDVLFTYVLIDPSAPPVQVMLQWFDGTGWEHRAYWGDNFIGHLFPNLGVQGTESQRYIGGLPKAGGWYRLEVPASYVGLEGKTVSGMAFSLYGKEPTATWDRSGKSSQITAGTVPLPLSATSGVFRFKQKDRGDFAFDINEHGVADHDVNKKDVFFVHPNRAAGTVPIYRFQNSTGQALFYSPCPNCTNPNVWIPAGIAFYVYPNGNTPGTVPLYLYRNALTQYFLTVDQGDAATFGLISPPEGIAGYVFKDNPPAAPSNLDFGPNGLIWQDNSVNETGFRIERGDVDWVEIGIVGANVTHFDTSTGPGCGRQLSCCVGFRVRAINQAGISDHASAEKCQGDANPDDPPSEGIAIPRSNNSGGAPEDLALAPNGLGSNGTVAKVEFFANSNKLGEVTNAPYIYLWNNVPAGTYALAATATNTSGTTFSPGPLLVDSPSSIYIASPANGDVINQNSAITANAFDLDGNGTITKVEFFANGNKMGEVTNPPYVFPWNNVSQGTYSLTAIVTDRAGATTTSDPVNVIVKLDQTITFASIPDKTYGDAAFAVNATSSSSLPISFSVVSGPASISGSTVTIIGTGTVTIRAAQGGDGNYNAAPDVDRSFNVAKASATIALGNLNQTYDGTAKPVTGTTDPAGLTGLSITYNGSATVPTSAGSYSIVASLANDNYTASDASGTLTIGKASQTITFNPPENKTYGDAPFAISASSSSGLPVSFSIVSGSATIAGNTVTLNGAGTVTLRASQSGNENYNAATDADRSFPVAKASATITLTNLNQNYDGTPKTVTATTNPSGLSGVLIKYNGSSTAPSNAGSYSVVASLTNDNYTATDATGTLIINAPPTVSITSPTNGALLHATSVTISASAADSDGSVSKVEFFQGSVKLGQVVSAPFNLMWNNVTGGSYSLTAVATDNSGNNTVSSPVTITVNNPPNISITASSPQDVPTAPAQIAINADANDADGTISKVDFYQGTTLLATDLTSPFSYTWSNVAAGNYSITAKATDNLGGVTTSNVVGISVNTKPSVSLTSPGSSTSFIAPALVSIGATASDSDGSISKVEFYQGSTLISTVTASPYSFSWSYVPAGTYILTAKATDNIGASTTSSGITITVTPNSVAIGKIAFASNRDGCPQIYLMNTDGTSQSRLTNTTGNDDSPKWSPNNSRIVFQSDRDFESNTDNPIYGADIYTMNWDGSGVTRLTNNAYDDSAPVWSPDGTRIAFQSARNGVNYQVYVMNADGTGQVNISNSTANDTQPSWSPDGTRIAFASDRDQPAFSSIYVMNTNGANQTRLTFSGSGFRDEQPAWSPDGMKLAFTTTRDSTVVTWDEWLQGQLVVKTKLLINKELYLMNADGSAQVRLTNTMGNDDSPVWSSDGTKIAFRSDRDRNCCDPVAQIWTMNSDGTNQLNLSNNTFGDYCPNWSR